MTPPLDHVWRILPAVRRSERSRVLFFAALLMLVSAAQTVGLAGSEALFLAELSARRLPQAFVIASIVTVLGSMLYALRVGSARNDTLFAQLLFGAGAALILVPVLAPAPGAPVLYGLIAGFYLTQSVFTNHFWTFSGDYFDTLTSKRLFPVFTVGSSVGGLFGGVAGVLTARSLGPFATIAVWGALLCAAALLLWLARPALRRWGPLGQDEADETSVTAMRGTLRYLGSSALGRWLAVSSLGMVLALFVAQYAYSDLFVRAYPDPAELAVFIAGYLALTNLVEIALELWLTPWLIRRFGVASAHVLHPLLTLASFGGIAAQPALAAAVVARANRELVENAVAQPVRTLVFNALPARFRGRIRAFLEGIVVYAGMSVAGLLLLGFDSPDLRLLAGLGAVASLGYLAGNLGARRAYLRALVEGIRSGRLDLADLEDEIGEWQAGRLAELCEDLLRTERERPSRALLQLIASLGQRGIAAPLLAGLAHGHPVVRARCAQALAGRAEAETALPRVLADPAAEVRLAALEALRSGAPELAAKCAAGLAGDSDARVRAAAAAARDDAVAALRAMLAESDLAARLAALHVAGPPLRDDLVRCAADPDPEVQAAALARLAEIAAEAVPEALLARALGAPAAEVRRAALRLAARGGATPERIAEALRDPVAHVRRAAAETLAARGESGVEAARRHLDDASETTADAALGALAAGDHPRRRQLLVAALRHRAREAWLALIAATRLPDDGDLVRRFLRLATADRLASRRRLAFRTLERLEGARVVQRVENALRSGSARARGDALEVLSNLGDRQAARLLVAMHEPGELYERLAALGGDLATAAEGDAWLAEAERCGHRWTRLALAALRGGVGETGGAEHTLMDRLLALKRVPLFEDLNLDQLEAVQQRVREATFLPGEVIVREGDAGGELYLLLEGAAEAWLDYDGPRRKRLSTMPPGSYFGEMAILDGEPRSATVVARDHTRLLTLDGASLQALVHQMPEIALGLLRVMTGRVRAAERRLMESE